jgi:hypothetical protein
MSLACLRRIIIGALFGFAASVVIFSSGLLIYPEEKLAGASSPGFNRDYYVYALATLMDGSILGLIIGVPIGAIGFALMPRLKSRFE